MVELKLGDQSVCVMLQVPVYKFVPCTNLAIFLKNILSNHQILLMFHAIQYALKTIILIVIIYKIPPTQLHQKVEFSIGCDLEDV